MKLTTVNKKHYRSLGHKLKPVVMIAGKGLTDNVHEEINRALDDHELIKIKLNIDDPSARREMAAAICQAHSAELIQSIGKIILILREAEKPKARLSNLLR